MNDNKKILRFVRCLFWQNARIVHNGNHYHLLKHGKYFHWIRTKDTHLIPFRPHWCHWRSWGCPLNLSTLFCLHSAYSSTYYFHRCSCETVYGWSSPSDAPSLLQFLLSCQHYHYFPRIKMKHLSLLFQILPTERQKKIFFDTVLWVRKKLFLMYAQWSI